METNSLSPSLAHASPTPNATPRRVSADSFRKLTSLLKKPDGHVAIPQIFPPAIAPAVMAPAIVAPAIIAPVGVAPVVEAAVLEAPTLVEPVATIQTAQAAPVAFEPVALEAEVAAQVAHDEIFEDFGPIIEPVLPIPAAAAAHRAPMDVKALPFEPVTPVMEAALAVSDPMVELQPEPEILQPEPLPAPMPTLRASPSMLRRQPKRDEFAEVLAVPKTPAAIPQLKPEQEAEQVELARSLIDMMSGSGAGGGQPHERALAADTLLRMLPRLPVNTRVVLSQRLAMMEAPPPFLVSRLLVDGDIAVSGPLLEDCMQIADENLFPVIAQGRADQLRLIARRRRLSRAVTEALVKAADASVLLTLVRNAAAEIPQEGFVDLAHAAAQNPELLPPLCIRQDLPIHVAFELFWAAPVQLRRYLLTRFLTDSETLTRILRITMQGEEGSTAAIAVEEVGAALELALEGKAEEAAQKIATAAGVSPATIMRIFADSQGEALMALLKVAGVSRADLSASMSRLCDGAHCLIDPARVPEELQAVFDQLSFTKARILLTYWDWAVTKSGPYATHH